MVLQHGEMMEIHHSNEANPCLMCLQKLKQAHPDIAAWFKRVKAAFPTVHVAVSYRGKEDQMRAFEEHKTRLMWPMSGHNQSDSRGQPAATALDLFNLSDDGVAMFPPLYYAKIFAWCQEHKEPIKWGGNFKSLGDSDHFQLV